MDEPAEALILADRLIHESGAFDAIEFLLRRGWIDRADHFAWRRGERAFLQTALLAPITSVIVTLEQAVHHAKSQGLRREARPAPVSRLTGQPLIFGSDPHFCLLCSGLMKPPADRGQGDLFQNNAEVFVRDALHAGLTDDNPEAASAALERLRQLSPAQASRYQPLLDGLSSDLPPALRIEQIESTLTPLARQLLQGRAAAYLAPLWAAVATRLQGQRFDPERPSLHASHAWLQAGHWRQAAASISEEGPDWSAEPELLLRMAAVETGLHRVADARRWRLRLCWQFPQQAQAALDQLPSEDPDRALRRHWQAFRDAALTLPVSEFPSWLLLAEPQQRDWLLADDPILTARESQGLHSWKLVHRLLATPTDVELRRQLKQRQPELLQLFLVQRERRSI